MKEDQKIVIYQTEDGKTQIDVRLENETVRLKSMFDWRMRPCG